MTSRIARHDAVTTKVSREEITKEVKRVAVVGIVRRDETTKIVREVVNGNSN